MDDHFFSELLSRSKELKILYLLTPQHTGTHYCRMLLESHPQISPCLYFVMLPKGFSRDVAIKYTRGAAKLEDWKRVIAEELACRKHEMRQRIEMQFKEWKIEVPPKKNPKYLFFHNHIHPYCYQNFYENNYGIHENFKNIETIVTVRDPLLSILSALRRTNNGITNAGVILRGIEYASHLKTAHFYCLDLWRDQPERQLSIFTKLGLPVSEAAERFAHKKPAINVTLATRSPVMAYVNRGASLLNPFKGKSSLQIATEGVQSHTYIPPLSEEEIKKWRDAKEMLVHKKKVHPALKPWVRVLQNHPVFETFYRKLGYQDLVWFK